jgi:hypothetical protein
MGLVFDWGGFCGEAVPCRSANGAHHVSLGHRPRCARHPIPSPEGAEQRVSPLQGSGGFWFFTWGDAPGCRKEPRWGTKRRPSRSKTVQNVVEKNG